ncbi:hypothetical protein [Streptomyces sedi]|uniref:Uncharacterized protein n=1 Tax=Streptomyces sedi TaxID=555059 RepID=A0A5C4VCB7_9ACTN|nr:hypothetical protein [Streptomyces sedi]TNM33543.1 hypothetical protein FH715_04100 [Streptomyces sedi]
MGSFLLKLVGGVGQTHHYLVVIDGGARQTYLLLDTRRREVVRASAEGTPTGDQRFALDGEASPREASSQEPPGGTMSPAVEPSPLSDEEFSLLAVHLRGRWLRDGQPPTTVVKYFY